MSALPKTKVMPCPKCEGRGFVNIRRFKHPEGKEGFMMAASVLKNGVACDCALGAWFAEQQMEWMKPVPEGREP